MRTLGIIGGVGPESTVEYYRRLLACCRERDGSTGAPSVLINSIDNKKLLDFVGANQLPQLVDYLAAELDRLARAGAGLALIAANTPHLVFKELTQLSRVPLLSIIETTCAVAKTSGLRRVGLLGTRFTMQASFYRDSFAREQIEIVVPDAAEQDYVHRKYMSELLGGIILPETRAGLIEIVRSMNARAPLDAVILGGTELSLILREPIAAGVRVLDTTQIHVEAAAAWLLDSAWSVQIRRAVYVDGVAGEVVRCGRDEVGD